MTTKESNVLNRKLSDDSYLFQHLCREYYLGVPDTYQVDVKGIKNVKDKYILNIIDKKGNILPSYLTIFKQDTDLYEGLVISKAELRIKKQDFYKYMKESMGSSLFTINLQLETKLPQEDILLDYDVNNNGLDGLCLKGRLDHIVFNIYRIKADIRYSIKNKYKIENYDDFEILREDRI